MKQKSFKYFYMKWTTGGLCPPTIVGIDLVSILRGTHIIFSIDESRAMVQGLRNRLGIARLTIVNKILNW